MLRIVIKLALTITVSATIIICIVLLAYTPDKQPASWVFTHFTDGSGWGSKFFSFLLGFISVAWTMTDYDGTTQCVSKPVPLIKNQTTDQDQACPKKPTTPPR